MPHVVLASGYDPAGNRKSLAATIAGTADFLNTYSYNTLSQLSMIDQQGQTGGNAVAPKSIYLGYDAIGDVNVIYRQNSVTIGPPTQYDPADTAISYDSHTGLLTSIVQTHGSATLENLSYTYDPVARVKTFTSNDGTATYGYDPTSQLTSATYTTAPGGTEPPNLSVSFDPNGNRTAANGTSTTIGPDNHLASDGTFNLTYDPAGNLATRVRISNAAANDYKTVYLWDYRDRLTDVEFYNNSGVLTQHVHYVYDVWDHLIERDLDPNGGGTYTQIVRYVWDGDNVVLAFNGSQQLIARYLNGPNTSAYDQFYTTLAEEDVTSLASAGAVTYDLLDPQASVDDIVDANGSLVDHIVYGPFGQTVLETNPSVSHIAGWQGGLPDSVTGMVNDDHRWYILADAVWASQDPLGLAGNINLTRFAANDPVNLSDPSGLIPRGGGHHDVPWSIFMGDGENAISGFSDGVIGIFGDALKKLFYNHGYDTWNGVSHADLTSAVRAELVRAMGGVDKAAGFSPDQARAFIASIVSGACPSGGDAKNWQTIRKYMQGLARSNVVAAAAIANGVSTDAKAQLKALAQLDDLSRIRNGLKSKAAADALAVLNGSDATKAMAFYKNWMGKGKLTAAAFRKGAIAAAVGKKLLTPLFAVLAVGHCASAYASDGTEGAVRAVADDLISADLIEELATKAFAPVGEAFDNALDTGQMNHALKRFGGAGIDEMDKRNMRNAAAGRTPGYQGPSSLFPQ